MRKSNSLKNIILLLEMFINNALNGLLNRPILAKKSVRIFILLFFLTTYFLYFFYNMKELTRITPNSTNVSKALIESGQKITFYSYFSNTLVLASIISVLVNNTVALDKTSLFFVKTLPFKKSDIRLAYTFFKFLIMILLYELVVIIATPVIKLITTDPFEYGKFFITQQMFFLLIIVLIECISMTFNLLFENKIRFLSIIEVIYNSLLIIISTLYFFTFRYSFESSLSKKNFTITELINISLFSIFIMLVLLIFYLWKIPSSDRITYPKKFVNVPSFEKVICRYKPNLYLVICVVLIIGTVIVQSGIKAMLSILPSILTFLGVLLLNYADSTSDFRKQYDLLRIKPWQEWLKQTLLIFYINTPLVIFYILGRVELAMLISSLCISVVALILGYLFPKSAGSLNETSSTVLLFIIFVVINLLMKNNKFDWLILCLLLMGHYNIVRKVRNEKL